MTLWNFIIIFVLLNLTTSQFYDDQPKILVSDGNLIFESAESRNVTVRLKGHSRFIVNNIDILSSFSPSNENSDNKQQSTIDSQALANLALEFKKLQQTVRHQTIRIENLEISGGNAESNVSVPTDRNAINRLRRRIIVLETRVTNLTERISKDYCRSYPCQNGGTCYNILDGYRCECPENFEGPQCNIDVNECAKYTGTELGCQNGVTCINTPGSYECSCMDGWKGKNCNRRKVDCLSVPQMEICGHGSCIPDNNRDGYSCICMQGWRKDNNSQACTQDIDECKEMRPHCSVDPPVLCVNTPGSFVCGPCPQGYTGNGFFCSDINECDINNGGCSTLPRVECINTRGSFRCGSCPFGFEGDGKTCLPSAQLSNQCSDPSICNLNAVCYQYPNSAPTCICNAGFTGNGFGENGCVPHAVDPCNNLKCKNGGVCMRNGTTAYCSCPPGTVRPLCDYSGSCSPNPCLNGGNCSMGMTGMSPYARCTCPRGFYGVRCENQRAACGGVRDEFNGSLRYPTDPNDSTYSHNSRCAWLIKTNHTKVLNITFQSFHIEHSAECRYDWLQIHDGRSAASHIIGRFCGTSLPKGGNIVSTHNQVYLWFRSDNSTSHSGFELSWQSIDPECGEEKNITQHGLISSPGSPGNYPVNRDCEWKLLAPPGKRIQFLFHTLMIESHSTCGYDYLEIHSGVGIDTPSLGKYCNSTIPAPVLTPGHTATVHFHSDGDSSDAGFQIAYSIVEGVPGCGGTFTTPRGDFSSPMDVTIGVYKNNLICDYVIQMPKDTRIKLEFLKFDLEESSTCNFDKVEIFEGSEYNEESLIGRYCGTRKPPVILSQANIVTVKFVTDWSHGSGGFQVQYQLVCGGIFTSSSGFISSPNYPNNYEGDQHCEYDIIAPLGQVIVLNVLDFDIERNSICEFDYLEIFDSSSSDNRTSLGRFCGDQKPGTFTSSFNHLHIEFSSDSSVFGRGFYANYSFIEIECGGIIKDSKDVVKPPMDETGNGDYKSNVECRWLVKAPTGYIIQMNIIDFDLEQDTQCKYDYIKIFNNGSGNGDQVGPYCGSNAPKIITTIDNMATILFMSDSSTVKGGFTITFSFIEATKLCGGNFYTSHGILKSPGTTNYLPNKDCEWTITAPDGQQIAVKFNNFDIESHEMCKFDGLEIRNGGTRLAPLLGKFCGETVPPPFKSMGNQLYIRFYSDSSHNGEGFELAWDSTTHGCGGILSNSKGSIQSPHYPISYPHNAQCVWRISVNEGSSIQIVFSDLDLEQHVDCKYDYLEVFDGVDASAKSFGKFCSSEQHPIHIETSGNHAMIRMNTDESHSGRGFHIKYSSNCNRTIEADTGVIESLNFPQEYPNNIDCAWTIKVSMGNQVNMQFSHFELENDNLYVNDSSEHLCKYDYVTIYDLDFEKKEKHSQTSKAYCNKAPLIRNSTTDAVVVIFHTDESTTNTGFRLEWYNIGCGGKLTHPNGSLTSPNYPRLYTRNLICIWEISVDYGYNIVLTIQDLEFEAFGMDSLTIAHDKSFNNTITKVSHSIRQPAIITVDGHQVFIKFESDDSVIAKGFNITYETVFSNCGGIFKTASGIIKTSSYPTTNYENNKTCEWLLQTDSAHHLIFQLTDFDLEESDNCTKDALEIYDPIFDEMIWRGCGSQMPNTTKFMSKRNELVVRLITDDTINAKGFVGNFSVNCGSRVVTNDTGEIIFQAIDHADECLWTIIADNPSKHVTLTFTHWKLFGANVEECSSYVHIYEGDIDSLGAERIRVCGHTVPPTIVSHGNALTVFVNFTRAGSAKEFDLHYSVLDNACGGIYKKSIQADFASPNYPESSALNTYCEWRILASAGNTLSLEIKSLDIAISENCHENYLEVRKIDASGELVGLYCGKELPSNLASASSYWIKYRTGDTAANNGFLARYKYFTHTNLEGPHGIVESPIYHGPLVFTYRISVHQGYVIRIEFKDFYSENYDLDHCKSIFKIYDGYDATAMRISYDICKDNHKPIISDNSVVFIETNFATLIFDFKLEWNQVDRNTNAGNHTVEGCGNEVISLNNVDDFVNFTSPGYPYGYNHSIDCEWKIISGLLSFHPAVQFIDVDLEYFEECHGDYVSISTSKTENLWQPIDKLCQIDIRDTKTFQGTPNLKVDFHSDYGQNQTGFAAMAFLVCGNDITDPDGIIDFDSSKHLNMQSSNCMWNITVGRGRKIKFEFLELNIMNESKRCDSYVVIKDGHDDFSPYLGSGQYCDDKNVDISLTSSHRAFVKYKNNPPFRNSFKLRYSEVQHECGGQVTLSPSYSSSIITSPNYPNIPHPHIECTWIIMAPLGEQIRIDFLERFDLSLSYPCEKEFVELREGSSILANLIGSFCGTQKPATKYTKSNVLRLKYFTDIAEPQNGFKVNVSIGICGGTMMTSDFGYLSSPKYPGVGAYPDNAICEYRVIGPLYTRFSIKIIDIDLPSNINSQEGDTCTSDNIKIYSIVPDGNFSNAESLNELGTYCGDVNPKSSIISDSNEILIRFKTFKRTSDLYRGFKLFYNASKLSCGGQISSDSGFITSIGYPSRTLNKALCEWRLIVTKGKRIKLEFVDLDLYSDSTRFTQIIRICNDFSCANRIALITDNTNPGVMYSSDNKIMIQFWIKVASQNRGFKIKFTSDDDTVCFGDLDQTEGTIYPPAYNTSAYYCTYHRTQRHIIQSSPNTGTLAYYFTNIKSENKYKNCRYVDTVVNVIRESGVGESETYLARICRNTTTTVTVLSPFPDVKIEAMESTSFGKLSFELKYKTHACGGIFKSDRKVIKNPPPNTADYDILDCAWYVNYDQSYSVAMSIKKLNLKLPCEQEYLIIYNGPTASSPQLIKLCGNEFNSDQLLSQCESVFIEYHTDNFIGVSKNSEFEIETTMSTFGCGGILNEYKKQFSTPLYDKPYPPNTECIWEIRASSGYSVGLKFTGRFYIEQSPNCTKDYLEVHDYVDNEWKLINKFCGRDAPKQINSTYSRLKVIFRSDGSINGEGFNAEWSEICGGIITVDHKERILSSPKYPENYPPSLNCNYTFVPAIPDAYVSLKFLDFDVQSSSGKCIYDNITIYLMSYTIAIGPEVGKLGLFCGTNSPGTFRYEDTLSMIFMTDKWNERKGFQIQYSLDTCGGSVTKSTIISSAARENANSRYRTLSHLNCVWRITAPIDKKIVIKISRLNLEYTDLCTYDYAEIYKGHSDDQNFKIAQICGNWIPNPIVIDTNEALIKLRSNQLLDGVGFEASIQFQQRCDEKIYLTESNSTYIIDKSNQLNPHSLECIFKVTSEPLSVLKFSFSVIHLSICGRDQPHANMSKNVWKCNCDYVEILNGNGPFSELIGRYCGHDLPTDVITSGSAAYIRFVTNALSQNSGFKMTIQMIESPCGSTPVHTFSSNYNETFVIESPKSSIPSKYPPNIRCQWTIVAPLREYFEISFDRFELEESDNCSSDYLRISNKDMTEYVVEGLGEEIIYNGFNILTLNPSFYLGAVGPNAPHIYCGSRVPQHYHSETEKINIMFKSNSENEFAGFKMTIRAINICNRTYTALQGRVIFEGSNDKCKTTIRIPEGYAISLFFNRFQFYDNNCENSFMKIYDGDFEKGALLNTFCGYETPNPVFSTGNHLSIFTQSDSLHYDSLMYDIIYVASEKAKGPGCGGEIFNYGGIFSSPLYPNSNRSNYDCTWTVSVPQNLKLAIKFSVFDMGSRLTCDNDYVEILEENESKKFVVIKSYCGDDKPAIYTSAKSKIQVHYKQSVHFPGTGWMINFMGIHEGATPSEW